MTSKKRTLGQAHGTWLVMLAILTLTAPLAAAATYTVTSTGDGPDANTLDGICDDGSGACTLRAAIEVANATANESGEPDRIHFAIPGEGPHRIQPLSGLPGLTEAVMIDGYTQPGSLLAGSDSNAVLQVEIDGSVSGSPTGFFLGEGPSTLRGLAIFNFADTAPGDDGVQVRLGGAAGSGGHVVEGNHIGLDAAGNPPPPLCDPGETCLLRVNTGIRARSSGNRIGGGNPASRNVIFGHGNFGVQLEGLAATGNVVQGNHVVSNVTGIAIQGAEDNLIGGDASAQRNVVSGGSTGIWVFRADRNVIEGNFVGTDPTGRVADGNGSGILTGGVFLSQSVDCRVLDNLISGNGGDGINIALGGGTLVLGNRIGIDVDGNPLGNGQHGIHVQSGSHRIGGLETGEGNVIAHSGGVGALVLNEPGTTILSNSIFGNARIGIDVGFLDGPTPNDPGDMDSGPNDGQNFPVLTQVIRSGSAVSVEGTLDSVPEQDYRVQLFSNESCHPTGFGEGRTLVAQGWVSTDASGSGSFVLAATHPVGAAEYITGTATNQGGSTSEFSACLAVNQPPVARCTDVEASAGPTCEADVSVDAGSFDPDGDAIQLAQAPPGPYPLGDTSVTLQVTDVEDAQVTCDATVTVVDLTDPLPTCPSDQAIPATSPDGAPFSFSTVTTDNCPGASAVCLPSSGSLFAIGSTTVQCDAQDSSGNESSCSFEVRVKGAEEQLTDLVDLLRISGLPGGLENSLVRKLDAALAHLTRGNAHAACRKLADFDNEVAAQRDKALSIPLADRLGADSLRIQTVIGC